MEQEVKKLSYEELEKAAQQLSVQIQALQQKNEQLVAVINNLNIENVLQRLDWLWKIVNSETSKISEDFKNYCAEEVVKILTPESEAENKDTEESK